MTSPLPWRTPRCCTGQACSTDEQRDGLLAGLDSSGQDVADRQLRTAGQPMRTCTARWSAA